MVGVKKPVYKIVVNDKDVIDKIRPYFSEIGITDNDKDQADELTLTLTKRFKKPNFSDKTKCI